MDPSDQGPWPPTKDMCLDLVYVNLGAGTHGNLSGLRCRIRSGFDMKKCPAPLLERLDLALKILGILGTPQEVA